MSCLWNFGDGSSSAVCGTVNHLYNTPGNYSVSLTITSPEGCVNDTTMVDLVEIYDYPTALFDANPNPADILNPEVDFQDLSSSSFITSKACNNKMYCQVYSRANQSKCRWM